jgi:prepilin-type N-terminal cleavage/methylation domain-containing protein
LSLRTRQSGLTLVELLLGLAITAIVMAPLVPMLQTAAAAASATGNQAALEQEANFALERIAARIRATAPTAAVKDKPYAEWLKPAVYTWSGSTLTEKLDTKTSILAESVTGFAMTVDGAASDEPLITVSLSLANDTGSTSATIVVRMGTAQ